MMSRSEKQRPRHLHLLGSAGLAAILGGGVLAALRGVADERAAALPSTRAPRREMQRLLMAAAAIEDPRINEVARRFHCPCGGCGVMELVNCECDMPRGALEAKGKIAELLKQGVSPPEVIERMAAAYGSRKAPAAPTPGR